MTAIDGAAPTAPVLRTLRKDDLDRLVRMDREITGRPRRAFFESQLTSALRDTDVVVSLAAEHDGVLVGAVFASVRWGEFGQAEPFAVLDTLLVDRAFQRRGVASALVAQLRLNLQALRVERLRTEVDWNEHDLVGFLAASGFSPVPRLVLEARLDGPGA